MCVSLTKKENKYQGQFLSVYIYINRFLKYKVNDLPKIIYRVPENIKNGNSLNLGTRKT